MVATATMNNDFKAEDLDIMLNLHFNNIHQEMKEYAKINNVPIIQDEGLAFLETIIAIKRPKKILEIGSAIGYSATRMAMVSGSEVITIERDMKMYDEAIKNIKKLNLEDKIKVIFKDALDSFEDVKNEKFDMIFIDAAKGQYINFFNLYEPLLNDDGIIVTDNMLFHGLVLSDEEIKSRSLRGLIRKLKNYHSFLLNNPNYRTSIFNIGDGMSVSCKK
ncbi:MAG: O-methyltransferase [Anaeroplasmataceae bacterium]